MAITNISPTSGITGQVITISTDYDYGYITSITYVKVGGVNATNVSQVDHNDTVRIYATVASGATGTVSVRFIDFDAAMVTDTSSQTFTYYTAPTISSFTPSSAGEDSSVTITGTYFTGATSVKFGGTEAASFTINSATSITAVVGIGSSGYITVTTPGGTATSEDYFTHIDPPSITSFTPSTGGTGNTVTITGTNFTNAALQDAKFGSTSATSFSVVNATTITAVVAAGSTGLVGVRFSGIWRYSSGTFTYNVTPTAVAQSVTTNEDTAVSITLVGTDPEGNTLSYYIVSGPTYGSLGSFTGTPARITVYTPNANIHGADSFTFRVHDGYTYSSNATVSITITSVNDIPLANAQSVSTDEDTAKAITLTGSDVEGSTLTYSIVSNPSNGALSGTAPSVTYTPTSNFNGTDSFTFKVNDGTADSSTAIVTITVNAVNDPPSFTSGGNISVNRNSGAYSNAWATNLSAGPSNESGQTLSFTVTNNNNSLFSVQPTVNASGVLTFTPTTNRPTTSASSETATVTISIQDDGGTANGGSNTSANQTFVITVAFPTPTISSGAGAVDPNVGGLGTTVTINGTNFRDAGNNNIVTVVSFGGTAATSFTVVSATSITAVVGSGTTGTVLVTTYGGTATKESAFTFFNPPNISSFTPTSRAAGLNVVITGTNFTGVTAVSFGGTAATSFTVVSATSITAVVGSGSSGIVSVTNPGGTATLAGFTIIPAPTISSFTAASGKTGDTITITGTSFNTASSVAIGGTAAASFTVVSATSITAVVGSGTTGVITVTTEAGTATSTGTFTFIPAPTITSFTPTSGVAGATITITGTNFTGATIVNFGGTAAASFTVVSATSITAVVGAGTDGTIVVTTPGGTATSSGTFDFYVSATLPTDNFSVLDVISSRSTVFPSAASTTSLKYLLDTYVPNRVNDSLDSLRDFGGYTFSNLGG